MKRRLSLSIPFFTFLFCAIIYLILIILTQPIGEFLVTDEWMFIKVVKGLLDTGKIKFVDIMPMSFVAQAYMGIAFCKIFGFSFSSLKILSILISFIGAFSLYLILRELECSEKYSILGMLLLIFNPIYMLHGLSFRTDIPFITFMLLGIYYFIKAGKTNSLWKMLLGSIFLSISTLIRQFGILAMFPVIIFGRLFKKKALYIRVLILILPFFVLGVFYWWYFNVHGPTALYKWHQGIIKNAIMNNWRLSRITDVLEGFLTNLLYLGFYISPVTIAVLCKRRYRTNIVLPILGVIFSISYYIVRYRLKLGYDIYNFGLGSPDMFILGANSHFSIQNTLFWFIVVVISALGGIFILFKPGYLFRELAKKNASLSSRLILGEFVILFGFITYVWLDSQRYLLMAVPFVIAVVIRGVEALKPSIVLSHILIIPICIFSVGGTQDYVNWHKAEWGGIRFLEERGIPLRAISGGAEFADWYFYDKERLRDYPYSLYRERYFADGKVGDRYAISMAPIYGYQILKKIKYRTIMKNVGEDKLIYVLRKKPI